MRSTVLISRLVFILCLVLSRALFHAAAARAAFGAPLVLVQDGVPQATIVTAASPTKNAQEAAAELQKYVRMMSGATLPMATDASPPAADASPASRTLILVGQSRLTDQIPDLDIPTGHTRNLREEGFIIRTLPGRLVLAGNDSGPYLGTRYAVVELLHALGVRWFMPGEKGEVVPKQKTIAAAPMDIRQQPDFPLRNWWEHAKDDMAAQCREWKIHNKMNPDLQDQVGVPADGSLAGFLPRDQFEAHPEWFALQRDGTRSISHPCMTSEGMIQAVAERVKARARAGAINTAFSPDDGLPRCWCDGCARLANSFDGYGANDRDPVPESSISNEWFYFCNRVLNEVNREFPDFMLAVNGYANRDIPPELPPDVDFNPRKNLVVMFANICACTIHAYDDPKCWQMKRQGQMVRQWCRLSDKVWMYNYNYTMCVNKRTLTPMVHRLRRNIPLLHKWGVMGFFDQDDSNWALCGLPTRLVRARLEWGVDADVDAILDDFFTKWFGPAAEPMKAYYAALEDAFEKAPQHGHEDVILPAIYSEALMEKLAACMRQAQSAISGEPYEYRLRLERLIYENLCDYVAMEAAKRAGRLDAAVRYVQQMIDRNAELHTLTPFMGWSPYEAYGLDWEKRRLSALAAKVNGQEGQLVALLPERARFRTDPFDDGRFERWQDLDCDTSGWRELMTTAGWDTQGLHDEQGHPYRGVAWYQFDVDIPESAKGKAVFLQGMGVVNEAWVWVNGAYAGHRPYKIPWFRPHHLELDVSKLIEPGRKNRITIRVLCNFDVWGANGIYERMFLFARNQGAPSPAER